MLSAQRPSRVDSECTGYGENEQTGKLTTAQTCGDMRLSPLCPVSECYYSGFHSHANGLHEWQQAAEFRNQLSANLPRFFLEVIVYLLQI